MRAGEWPGRGKTLPSGARIRRAAASGADWRIVATDGERSYALLARPSLHSRWIEEKRIESDVFLAWEGLFILEAQSGYLLSSIDQGPYPESYGEMEAFAVAYRLRAGAASLAHALYIEQLSAFLPTYADLGEMDNATCFGKWLSAGVEVPVHQVERLFALIGWLPRESVADVFR